MSIRSDRELNSLVLPVKVVPPREPIASPFHVLPVPHKASLSQTACEGRPAMGAYSESVDVFSLSQTVSECRPVMGAYGESVDVTESQDPLKADADCPPLGFGQHPTSA